MQSAVATRHAPAVAGAGTEQPAAAGCSLPAVAGRTGAASLLESRWGL
jgi:hypothetical protein